MSLSPEQIDLLRGAITMVKDFPVTEWDAFAACWQPVNFKRKALITAAGEIERYCYFVLEGTQRAFYGNSNKQ